MAKTTVLIKRSPRNGRWYISSIAGNNERGPSVQSYTTKASARRGAHRWFPGAEIRVVVSPKELR